MKKRSKKNDGVPMKDGDVIPLYDFDAVYPPLEVKIVSEDEELVLSHNGEYDDLFEYKGWIEVS